MSTTSPAPSSPSPAALQELLDRAVLRNLVESYASFCDAGEPDRVAGLFTEDAVLVVALKPGEDPTAVRTGRTEIAGAMANLSRYWSTMHVIANVHAEIDGDTARGVVGCVAHHIEGLEGERRDRVLNIRYVDEYAKTEGTWRIKRREVRVLAVEKRPLTIE
ncbi:MAG TPA: nuclear transport factor 2 family protein [Frankiaceae bacterium]|nr:nuclear transport factor 2 family protein [Frankiaceae bacterium]